jgi:acetyltransferase-like isoleucine patch superfamily enzyme
VIYLFTAGQGWQPYPREAREEFEKRGITIACSALIGDGVHIGRKVNIKEGAIIAGKAVIGRRAVIGAYAIVGYQAVIGNGASISAKQIIGHGASIEPWDKPPLVYILGRKTTWPIVYWGQDRIDIGCQSQRIEDYFANGRDLAEKNNEGHVCNEYAVYVKAIRTIHEFFTGGRI